MDLEEVIPLYAEKCRADSCPKSAFRWPISARGAMSLGERDLRPPRGTQLTPRDLGQVLKQEAVFAPLARFGRTFPIIDFSYLGQQFGNCFWHQVNRQYVRAEFHHESAVGQVAILGRGGVICDRLRVNQRQG